MLRAKIITTALKAIMWIALLGVGVWYLADSLGGGSLSYVSLDSFLRATGACADGVCDIAQTNGCFLCFYVERLFYTIGSAAYSFWDAIIDNVWILLAVGFAIFLFIHTAKFLNEQNKLSEKLNTAERKFPFKTWFDKVWKQLVRVLIVGALIGGIGYGGVKSIKLVADVTITPVMFIGSELAMAATGVNSSADCGSGTKITQDDIMGPAMRPFMCVVGNLNTVILAGAAGGFSLMNYSWMGLGGGMFTWIAGLALVLMFLIIGFNIFFKILTVVFQLVFIIIFLPLIIAAWAYENQWKMMQGVLTRAINMLGKCAVRIVAITLHVLIIYAMVVFTASQYFPGPPGTDSMYSPILPAGIVQIGDAPTPAGSADGNAMRASIMDVFSKCEAVGTDNGTVEMDKDKFKNCFISEKARVEVAHPGAFDFMENGLEFLLMMIGLFLVYFYCIQDRVDEILGGKKMFGGSDGGGLGEEFEFGKFVRDIGNAAWSGPQKMLDKITKTFEKK